MGHAAVTGGSSGIGLALAKLLAAKGWNVTILARDRARLDSAAALLTAARKTPNQRIIASAVDVADPAALNAAVEHAVAELGPPDLAVASAGIVIPETFTKLTPDAFRRTMEVNYFGTVDFVRACLPSMRANGKGKIVLVSSGAGLIGLYGYSAYAPSKFAVRGFGEALRSELKPEGIAVSVVFPPDTDTPQLREELRVRPAITSKIAGGAKVKTAEEIAHAILAGIDRGRFIIAPGFEMAMLARFSGILGPLLNRVSFDPLIARMHKP
ncbi:MAG TPA: SDR family oxidoreductase [Rhizomicrobium sp.]|nr:SDR family oxidoreductase [Rhizomicrobium sp.]